MISFVVTYQLLIPWGFPSPLEWRYHFIIFFDKKQEIFQNSKQNFSFFTFLSNADASSPPAIQIRFNGSRNNANKFRIYLLRNLHTPWEVYIRHYPDVVDFLLSCNLINLIINQSIKSRRHTDETIHRSLAIGWLFCNRLAGNHFAFFIWLAWKNDLDCTVFGGKRIDVGAYEAPLLANASFRCDSELLFQRS